LPRKRCCIWIVAATCFAACGLPLRAQTLAVPGGKGEKEPDRTPARGAVVERVEPDIYYTRDSSGELVPLLNYSLDEIKKLIDLKGESTTVPRTAFRLERLAIKGEATGSNYVQADVDIFIVVNGEGWSRVPLRLANLALTELPRCTGAGEHIIECDPESREYVAWLRGKSDEACRLSLRGLINLENDGGQTRLKLNAPRAVVSELQLNVPAADAAGQVASGGILTETQHTAGRTVFRASGLASDFILSWRNEGSPRGPSSTALSVEGEIVCTIDGGGVNTTAALKVNAFGREFNSFQVRLPRGATLLPSEAPDYTVAEAAGTADGSDEQRERKLVEVRLKTKTALPVRVKLVTNQGHDVSREGTFELGGFDCTGAVRQSGYLAVRVEDDWQVTFVRRQGVLQTDTLPPELHSDATIAGFLYFGQPFSLPVHVAPRQTRTAVEPRYVVQVSPHHLQLDATFKYHIAGAKLFSVSLNLNDWQLDIANLEPATLVNKAALVFGAGNSVLIPLKQATTDKLELKIRATKQLAADATTFDFGLPRASADATAPAVLTVLADDNVVLVPRHDMSGFSNSSADPDAKLPSHRQAPWTYQSDVADPRFAADFRVASRRIVSRVAAAVVFSSDTATIEEKLHCLVSHEAAESLTLVLPQSLALNERLHVRCNDTELAFDPVSADQASGGDVAVRVHLPEPLLGAFELAISYDWPGAALDELLSRATTIKLEVPLVMPGEGEFTRGEVVVNSERQVEMKLVDKEWTASERQDANGVGSALRATTTKPHTLLALGISPVESTVSDSLVVERAWVQTWLTDKERIDRAIFRFRCRDGQIVLRLPPGQATERFRIDDNEATISTGENPDERIVALPEVAMPDAVHVLELTYELEQRPGGWGRLSLPMPVLVTSAPPHPIYWQVLLPHDEFLLAGPDSMANDFTWVWQTPAWRRQPLRQTSELELWSGSRQPEEPLPPSVNTYLFSGLTMPGTLEITTISRVELILVSSGVVLALGLIWIYFPVLRRPAWLFVTAMVLLAAAASFPDLSLLFVQAAAVGVLLVLLAGALDLRLSQQQRQVVFRSGPSSIVGRSSTHSHPRPASLPSSTRTAALAMELGAEPKP
jgi:hypothetical protein